MSDAKMTLWGIERFLNSENKSIFDLLNLPVGMDKDKLLNAVLLDGGEFGVVYQDADFIRVAVGAWSDKYEDTFKKWWEVWTAEYNPLYNYDRTEIMNDNENNLSTNFGKGRKGSNASNQTSTRSATEGTDELKTSAYDESDYSPKEKRINEIETEGRGTDTHTENEHYNNDDSRLDTRSNRHKGHLFGNIGVTQTTELLSNEDKFREDFNPYKLITDLFIVDFLIAIY